MRTEVARFYDPEEAIVAQSFLHSSGIECVLLNDQHAGVDPHLRVALGGVRLVTWEEDRSSAKELLESVEQGLWASAVEFIPTRQVTPLGRTVWLVFAFMMGIPFLPRKVSVRVFFIMLSTLNVWVLWPGLIRW